MKRLSACGAVVVALSLSAAGWGFEGKIPLFKSASPTKEADTNTTESFDVPPRETRERIARIDPETLWKNWSDSELIPSNSEGAFKTPIFPLNDPYALRGSVALNYDAIVVWNGVEGDDGRELLIFKSREKTYGDQKLDETDVELGITPLSGKPIWLKRVGDEFSSLKDELTLRFAFKYPQYQVSQRVSRYEYAPYCAFCTEAKDVDALTAAANAKLSPLSVESVAFREDDQKILNSYFTRGFENFVFEISGGVDAQDRSSWFKAPLAVCFETPRLFVPVEIGNVGLDERIAYNLLVFTPCQLKRAPDSDLKTADGANAFMPIVFPKSNEPPMIFTFEDFREFAPTVAEFCQENGITELTGRDMFGTIDVSKISGDLEMVSHPKDSSDEPFRVAWTPTAESKAHILLIWAFSDDAEECRRYCATIECQKFAKVFETIEKAAPGRITVKKLVGKDVTTTTLLEECVALSNAAEANDAVFVYVFTPSVSLKAGGGGNVENALTPQTPSILDKDPQKYGTLRETVRNTIASRPHRLNVLIVDEAPTFILQTPYRTIETFVEEYKERDYSYLVRFLLEGKGIVDVSSNRPYRGKEYEDPLAWIPLDWSLAQKESLKTFRESCLDDRFSGTVFANAFLELADADEFADFDLKANAFVDRLSEVFQTQKEKFNAALFKPQPQNLSKFGRNGSQILVE